jgi:hypothetical protein
VTTFTDGTGPFVEVPEGIADDLVDEFERCFYWLLENRLDALGLEEAAVEFLVMELCEGELVPEEFGEAVGVSVIHDPRTYPEVFHDELRMIVAVGDGNDYSRLTTVAHELGHLADFWSLFHATPREVARLGAISQWPEKAANCHSGIEDIARDLTDEYELLGSV